MLYKGTNVPINHLWRSSVLLWDCSRSHPPWTSTLWAAVGSQEACSTSYANLPCPGSPTKRLFVVIISDSGWGHDFALLNYTCESFSVFSSSLAAWTLNFKVSYCRMAAAPNEQPVNWHEIQCCHTVPKLCSCDFSHQCLTGGTYPHCEHQWFQKCGSWGFRKRCGFGSPSLSGWWVCFFQDISFLCIWSFGFSTEATPLLFVVT